VDPKEYISSGIIESYVLGLTSTEEGEEFERMCAAHSDIRMAREQFEQQLEQNAIALGMAPPKKLKSLVLSEIEIDAQKLGKPANTVPQQQEVQQPTSPRIGTNIWRYAAAAAVILLAGSAFLNMYLLSQYRRYSHEYSQLLDSQTAMSRNMTHMEMKAENYAAAMKMMHDTNMAMVKMSGVRKHWGNSAMVFWDKKTKNVYLMADNLPQPPKGMQYQLWAFVNGKAVDAGLLNWDNGNMMTPLTTIASAEAFAITLEKAGGSAWPNEESMYVMGNT
jgi:anti-sigma-K factor RskA